jgi:hypothetical protein
MKVRQNSKGKHRNPLHGPCRTCGDSLGVHAKSQMLDCYEGWLSENQWVASLKNRWEGKP